MAEPRPFLRRGSALDAAHPYRTDHARARQAAKRGGGGEEVTFDEATIASANYLENLLALEEALTLAGLLRRARLPDPGDALLRRHDAEETAEALGVSEPTIRRELRLAKAWLRQQLTLEKEDTR